MSQKRDVLEQRLKLAEQTFLLGQITNDRVLSARLDLLGAELDLATSKAERIDVLLSQIKILKQIEETLLERHQNDGDQWDAILVVQTNFIDTKIALLREKAKP